MATMTESPRERLERKLFAMQYRYYRLTGRWIFYQPSRFWLC
jgi:hypothetical protein